MSEYINNKHFEKVIIAYQFYKRQKLKYEQIMGDMKNTHQRNIKKYNDYSMKESLDTMQNEYQQICENLDQTRSQLAMMFHILSDKIAHYVKFYGVDTDDAIQEGVVICFEKIDRFNPAKGKAFNYMTTCVLNHFRQLYRSSKNYIELKKRYQDFIKEAMEGLFKANGKDKVNYTCTHIHDIIQ